MIRAFTFFLSIHLALLGAEPYKPKRINKAIELLEQGQPIYYATTSGGGYEEGRKLAKTWADYINYEMEHGAFDISALRAFMKGLVDAGPTKSGHRTPAVIVTLPVVVSDEATVRANAWMIQQVLGTGVHGILMCHARSPEGVRAFVEAVRYPFQNAAPGLGEGTRGSGSQGYASQIWGISGEQYIRVADTWPLNPKGEILLGLKVEDRFAVANVARSVAVPGIAFAEWGPGDMSWSLKLTVDHTKPYPPAMLEMRGKVFQAVKANKKFFLDGVRLPTIQANLKEGIMIGSGDEATANAGRRLTKRAMPW
ncbi:MAG: hypothetical protein IT167_19635 [Bryobacterales bacterium]|nr:hypothetical protein [Bryobacterales bacterium]